jgi:hypothetical protein
MCSRLYPVNGRLTWSYRVTALIFETVIRRSSCVSEPAAFIMTRKMLLGLKRRAEATAAQKTTPRCMQHDAREVLMFYRRYERANSNG